MRFIKRIINAFRPWHHFSVWADCYMPREQAHIYLMGNKYRDLLTWFPVAVPPRNRGVMSHGKYGTGQIGAYQHWSRRRDELSIEYSMEYGWDKTTKSQKISFYRLEVMASFCRHLPYKTYQYGRKAERDTGGFRGTYY